MCKSLFEFFLTVRHSKRRSSSTSSIISSSSITHSIMQVKPEHPSMLRIVLLLVLDMVVLRLMVLLATALQSKATALALLHHHLQMTMCRPHLLLLLTSSLPHLLLLEPEEVITL